MARPSKTAAIDFTTSHDLTHGLLDRAQCPEGASFVLLRDTDKKGLRLRITKAGGKHWQFETRIKGKLFTRALGEWPAVAIDQAKAEAHRLRGLTEQGHDPRELERQQAIERAERQDTIAAKLQTAKLRTLTMGDVWADYIEQRRPYWGALHYRDHIDKAKPGGLPSGRRGGGKPTQRHHYINEVRLIHYAITGRTQAVSYIKSATRLKRKLASRICTSVALLTSMTSNPTDLSERAMSLESLTGFLSGLTLYAAFPTIKATRRSALCAACGRGRSVNRDSANSFARSSSA